LSQEKEIDNIQEIIRRIRLVAFDFDGVFTDNMVYVFEDGTEAVRCFRSDPPKPILSFRPGHAN